MQGAVESHIPSVVESGVESGANSWADSPHTLQVCGRLLDTPQISKSGHSVEIWLTPGPHVANSGAQFYRVPLNLPSAQSGKVWQNLANSGPKLSDFGRRLWLRRDACAQLSARMNLRDSRKTSSNISSGEGGGLSAPPVPSQTPRKYCEITYSKTHPRSVLLSIVHTPTAEFGQTLARFGRCLPVLEQI